MDASYLEVGTEVIIWKPRYPRKEQYKGRRGTIVRTLRYCDEPGCCISGDSHYYWFPEELILASDEALLRPEERG